MKAAKPAPKSTVMARLPATLVEIRRLFDAFDWDAMAQQVEEETRARVAIVGPVSYTHLRAHET